MATVQLIISKDTEGEAPEAVIARMLASLPADPDFADVAHTIDGTWVDDEGDPL